MDEWTIDKWTNHFDEKLTWNQRIKRKIKSIEIRNRSTNRLISRQRKLGKSNKLVIHKCAIKPIRTYGIQLWGMATKSHIQKMESLPANILRAIINAPWYVGNGRNYSFNEQTQSWNIHTNSLTRNCYDTVGKLKRKHPRDLLKL